MSEGLVAAYAAASAEFDTIPKSKTATVPTKNGASYTYNYADLGDVLAHVRPILARHGLVILQHTELTDEGTVLVSQLVHASGESRDPSRYVLPVENASPQQVGALFTYHRRYQYCLVAGVTAEDDDDGQAAKDVKQTRRAPSPPRNVDRDTGEVRQRRPSPKILGARMNSHGFDAEKKVQFVSAVVGEPRKLDDCTPDELERVAAELDRVDAGSIPMFTPAGCVLGGQADEEPF